MGKCDNLGMFFFYQISGNSKVYRHFESPEGLSLAGGEKSHL